MKRILTALLLIELWAPLAGAGETGRSRDDGGQFMEVRRSARVHRGINKRSAVIARIDPGAVLRMTLRTRTEDCLEGWFERRQGGFICGEALKKSEATQERPCDGDRPDIREGLAAVLVTENNVPFFKKKRRVERRRPYRELLKGSVLTVRDQIEVRGTPYYETREGYFVRVEGTKKLPAPIRSLGVDVSAEPTPGAVVIGKNVNIYAGADRESAVTGTLARWSLVRGDGLESRDGYVALPSGGYARDADLALVRPAPVPKTVAASERWIAVDLKEQLLQAYEGTRLVRIIPCSTGNRGNTYPGTYRVQKKLRRQHMRLRMARIRVEDVQWVMFYDKDDGIAIHSAYWHRDFGTPASHGCVNLPPDDARWLFEWTEPESFPVDSIRFPLPRDSGARVVVF